jgi:hypothetical protein
MGFSSPNWHLGPAPSLVLTPDATPLGNEASAGVMSVRARRENDGSRTCHARDLSPENWTVLNGKIPVGLAVWQPKGFGGEAIAVQRAADRLHFHQAQASQTLRHVADQLRPKWPKLAGFIDDSETDVLSHLDFPEQHRSKLHSTNPLERLNKEVKRRADVVGIFPNEASIIRLIGAVLLEQNDEWQLQHRYMQVEAMAELLAPANQAEARQIASAA